MTPSRLTCLATLILSSLTLLGCPRATESQSPPAPTAQGLASREQAAPSAEAPAARPVRAAAKSAPSPSEGALSEKVPSESAAAKPAPGRSAAAEPASTSADRAQVAVRFLPAFGHDLEGLATSVFVEPETGRASLYVRDVQRYEFALRRARTQGALKPGLFGAGWRSDLDARVEREGAGYRVTRLRGQRDFLPTEEVPGGYVSAAGDVELLIETPEGFQLRDHLGRTFRFDSQGRLSGIVPEFLLTRSADRLVLQALADASSCELALDGEGRVAEGVFRAPGQPERTLRYRYQGPELVSVEREVPGLAGETRYALVEGRIQSVSEDGREVLRLEHDAAGRLSRLSDGEWTQSYRYAAGRSRVTTPEGTWDLRYLGSAEAPTHWNLIAPDQDESYAIDARGRVLIPDAMPRDTLAPERPLRRVAAAQSVEEPRAKGTTETVATPSGGTRRTTGVPGAQVVEEHDAEGRLVARTSADGRSESYAYSQDEGQGVVRKTDSAGEVTEFRYEGQRLVSVETPEGRRWTFGQQERQEDGTRVSLVDGPGGPQRFSHDARGRLIARAWATGESVRFGYDAAGEPASALGSDGSGFRNEYREGRLVARVSPGLREELSATDGVLTVKSPDATLRYTLGETEEVLESEFGRFVLRQGERSALVSSPAGEFRFAYDGEGQRRTLRYPGGLTLRWSYDGLGRVKEQVLERGGQRLLTLGASWDERNERRVERRDGAQTRYAYDERGRLASVALSSGATRSYAYDGDGNRTEEVRRGREGSRQTLSGLYDRRARLVSWGEETLRYDAAGRLLQRGAVRYGYNACGQLTTVQRPGQPTLRYAYDALGHRVERRRGQAVTRFVWDDDRLLAELGPGGRTRVYVYGAGRDLPLAYCDREGDASGEWVYLVANERHDVVAYLNAEGELCDAAAFLPFGELEQAPEASRPVFFAGQLVDRETGLVHMGRRDYCPELGRFLTPDPSGLHGGLNAYVYVSNRPLECVDPTGLSEEPSLLRSLWDTTRSLGESLLSEGRAIARRSPRQQLRRTLERIERVGEEAHALLERATGVDTKGLAREFVKDAGDTLGALAENSSELAGKAKRYLVKGAKKSWRNVRDSAEGALHLGGLHSDSEWSTFLAAQKAFRSNWTEGAAHDRALGLLEYPAKAGDLYLRVTNPALHGLRGPAPDLRRYAFDSKEMDSGQEFFLGTVEATSLLIPAASPAKASVLAVRSFGVRALSALGQGGLRELLTVARTNLGRQGLRAVAGAKNLLRTGAGELVSAVGDALVHPAFSLGSNLSLAGVKRALPGLSRLLTRSGSRQLRQGAAQARKAGTRAASEAPSGQTASSGAPATQTKVASETPATKGPPQEGMLAALKDPAGRRGGSASGQAAGGSPKPAADGPRSQADANTEGARKQGKKSKQDADNPDGCFLAGTLVATASGPRAIETIRVGEWVLSRDEVSHQQGFKRVVRLFRGQTDLVVSLQIGTSRSVQRGRSEPSAGESADAEASELQTIRCTTEHPFWVVGRGFVPASEVQAGERGLDSQGNELTYVSVEVRLKQAAHFNFEVEEFHTYFVSEAADAPAVWVHNSCAPPTRAELLKKLPTRVYAGRGVDPKFNRVEATPAQFNPRAYTVRAGDIEGSILTRKHAPANPDQIERVRKLSNEDLVKFRFEDPISSHGIKDGIRLTGGHHRTAEIARRIKAGELSPDTKVHLLLHD